MPTYDYECQRCGTMEVFQSMRDDPLRQCPECGSKRFSKLVSAGAGVIFKGSGFYETDYNRSKDYGKQSDQDQGKGGKGGLTGKGGEEPSGKAASGEGSSPAGDGKGAAGKSGTASGKAAKGAADK